jgi:hypothetical protein
LHAAQVARWTGRPERVVQIESASFFAYFLSGATERK